MGLGGWPQHLTAEVMPPKGERGQLIDDPAFFFTGCAEADLETPAVLSQRQSCMPVFYGLPRTVMTSAVSPETCYTNPHLDIGEPIQDFVSWSDARVHTWPPPGHTTHGWFAGECAGGHEGLDGVDRMCAHATGSACGADL